MADTIVKGKNPVAEHFGITTRQVLNWEKQGMPRLGGRRYDLVQIQLWRDGKQGIIPPMARGGTAGDSRQPFLTPQRGKDFQDERLKKAKAELIEMEVRQRRGELVESNDVEKFFVARIIEVRQGLLGLGRALPPLLFGKDERAMEKIISENVRHLLMQYSRQPTIRPTGLLNREEVLGFVRELLNEWGADSETGGRGEGQRDFPTAE